MAKTNIEWTNKVWNPISGCSRKSAGCENCYAETMSKRLEAMGQEKYTGLLNNQNRFNGVVKFDEDALLIPLKTKKPTTFFVNSMSDLFHENCKDEWIDKVFAVMALCPQHTFQILTKRADRMKEYFSTKTTEWVDLGITETMKEFEGVVFDFIRNEGDLLSSLKDFGWFDDWSYSEYGKDYDGLIFDGKIPLQNVWLGVSVENQKTADERIPLLLETPAAIRWLSCEPLLEKVDLTFVENDGYKLNCLTGTQKDMGRPCEDAQNKIDWVIVGGESGNGARPCDISWIRSIVGQCKSANVPVFVKQMSKVWAKENNCKISDFSKFEKDLQIREFPNAIKQKRN